VKPLDSNDGALVAVRSEPEEGLIAQAVPSLTDSDVDVPAARFQSEVVAAAPALTSATPSGASRVSRIVPLGSTEEGADERLEPAMLTRNSEVVRRAPASSDPMVAGSVVIGSPIASSPVASSPVASSPAANGPIAGSPIVGSPSLGSLDAERPDPRRVRAAAHVGAFAVTRVGTGLDPDDDDEATTVDAGAALTADEREALARRIHSAMEETLPHGTPLPEPVRPFEATEPARDRRGPFKRTMLLGLPKPESPASAGPAVSSPSPVPPPASAGPAMFSPSPVPPPESAGSDAGEPALLASVVRVVGPPTQPPPRRSRRVPSLASEETSEPDHEAFVLTHAIVTPDRPKPASVPPSKRTVEDSAPWFVERPSTTAANHVAVAAARASLPGVMLPPAPRAEDFEPASPVAAAPISVPPPAPLLRATIEPPAALSRTRPPMSQRFVPDLPLDELPASDPFAGFVAPPPSLAQRWLVVIVVALAVVGLCSLAAIALGLLGKTGW
jgi:hypothetical protein